MKKKYIVTEYVTIVREYYNIEAEAWEEAMTSVMDNLNRKPDHEHVLKGSESDWDAEDQQPPEEQGK